MKKICAFLFFISIFASVLVYGILFSKTHEKVEIQAIQDEKRQPDVVLVQPKPKEKDTPLKYEISPALTPHVKKPRDHKEITLLGTVTDDKNNPVEGVNLVFNGSLVKNIKTNKQGEYAATFELKTLRENDLVNIRFVKLGYTPQSLSLKSSNLSNPEEKLRDIALNRLSGFSIRGYVRNEASNRGVALQRVSFYSAKQQRATRIVSTDINGYFDVPYVPPGDDYEVRIITSANYSYDTAQPLSDIVVTNSPVDVSLYVQAKQENTDDFVIELVGTALQPLAGIELTLSQSAKSIATATTNENGQARFSHVPLGRLNLSAPALNMRVNGLEREKHQNTQLLADTGFNELVVHVLDKAGQAVSCKDSHLFYYYKAKGYTVRSSLALVFDESGTAIANNIGRGKHALVLNGCLGHQNHTQSLNIEDFTELDVLLKLKK